MMSRRKIPSAYRAMWLFAMFDLPVDGKREKREYLRFRKKLLREGFTMLQFSVYARYVPGEDAERVQRNRIRMALPDEGQVRLLSVTDRQFGKMEVFAGKKRKPPEDPPMQMALF